MRITWDARCGKAFKGFEIEVELALGEKSIRTLPPSDFLPLSIQKVLPSSLPTRVTVDPAVTPEASLTIRTPFQDGALLVVAMVVEDALHVFVMKIPEHGGPGAQGL